MENQQSQLIQTKICIPGLRPNILERERLVEQATCDRDSLMTLVSAPAGYGKTTLLLKIARKLIRSGISVAWYALDPSDNDPFLFASYLVASLGEALEISAALAPVISVLRSSANPDLEKILPAIINAVITKEQKCQLILDDYHFISSPAIHSTLSFLLDHLPGNLRVMIGSRSDPPLPIARMRARRQLSEIRTADLRFTREEASRFLNEIMCIDLSQTTIAEIETSTEGWVTGLLLTALTISGQADSKRMISHISGDNRYLVEYLLQEVVERQPADVQEFLMTTSVLGRLCGPLCDALSGQTCSDATLRKLEQSNLFMIPLDDRGYWYRYHHLFQDFLRTRLKQDQPERIPLLHQTASEWYASERLFPEAVAHAFETHNRDYAAEVVERHGMRMFMRSEIALLHKWCEAFPEEVFQRHPLLCILHGWTLSLSYRIENRRKIEERVQLAEQAAGNVKNEQHTRWLTGQAELVRLSMCLIPDPFINTGQQISLANHVLDLLPEDDPFRSFAISALGYAYMAQQDVPLARQKMEAYRNLSLKRGNYYGAIAATFYLAFLQHFQGQLQRARDICKEEQASIALAIANPEQDLPAIGSLDIVQGWILLEENQLVDAEKKLLHGLGLIEETNNPFYRMIACLMLFRLYEIQGNNQEALQHLHNLDEIWPDIGFCTQGFRIAHLIRTAPEDKQTRIEAESWCKAFFLSGSDDFPLPGMGPFGGAQAYYLASLAWVKAQIYLGKARETLPYLEKQQQVAKAQGLVYRQIELSLLEAQGRKASGDDPQVFKLLEHALQLGQQSGFLRIFDQGPEITQLLLAAAAHGIAREYIRKIINAMGIPLDDQSLENLKVISAYRPSESLSDRELEVLKLLAHGLSNQEMAGRLYITVGTVKSHVNHILGKLGVRSRLEAVVRARERGLLND